MLSFTVKYIIKYNCRTDYGQYYDLDCFSKLLYRIESKITHFLVES